MNQLQGNKSKELIQYRYITKLFSTHFIICQSEQFEPHLLFPLFKFIIYILHFHPVV